jgi:hypothetical protein
VYQYICLFVCLLMETPDGEGGMDPPVGVRFGTEDDRLRFEVQVSGCFDMEQQVVAYARSEVDVTVVLVHALVGDLATWIGKAISRIRYV